jgi:hypothetical protein
METFRRSYNAHFLKKKEMNFNFMEILLFIFCLTLIVIFTPMEMKLQKIIFFIEIAAGYIGLHLG